MCGSGTRYPVYNGMCGSGTRYPVYWYVWFRLGIVDPGIYCIITDGMYSGIVIIYFYRLIYAVQRWNCGYINTDIVCAEKGHNCGN
jgi:hypothetical protein